LPPPSSLHPRVRTSPTPNARCPELDSFLAASFLCSDGRHLVCACPRGRKHTPLRPFSSPPPTPARQRLSSTSVRCSPRAHPDSTWSLSSAALSPAGSRHHRLGLRRTSPPASSPSPSMQVCNLRVSAFFVRPRDRSFNLASTCVARPCVPPAVPRQSSTSLSNRTRLCDLHATKPDIDLRSCAPCSASCPAAVAGFCIVVLFSKHVSGSTCSSPSSCIFDYAGVHPSPTPGSPSSRNRGESLLLTAYRPDFGCV
jgi:hypothetical protein